MARKRKIEKFIEEITKDNAPVKSRTVILSKEDIRKKHNKKRKKRKPIETGFIMDDFEILI